MSHNTTHLNISYQQQALCHSILIGLIINKRIHDHLFSIDIDSKLVYTIIKYDICCLSLF